MPNVKIEEQDGSEAEYKILLARLNKNRKTKEEQERDEQEELALSPESWLIKQEQLAL
jgi:hypothetical protein